MNFSRIFSSLGFLSRTSSLSNIPVHNFRYMSSTTMSRFNHKGIFVATFTPMKENGFVLRRQTFISDHNLTHLFFPSDINPDVVPKYVDHLVRNNIVGVFGTYDCRVLYSADHCVFRDGLYTLSHGSTTHVLLP